MGARETAAGRLKPAIEETHEWRDAHGAEGLEHTSPESALSARDDWFVWTGPTPGPGDSDGGGFD